MAYSLQDTNDLTTLGNAIRAKTGGSSNMTVAEMATAVAGISSGGDVVYIGVDTASETGKLENKYGVWYHKGPASWYNNIYLVVSNFPRHCYISYLCCNMGTQGPSTQTYQNTNGGLFFLYEYDNGTLTGLVTPTSGLKIDSISINNTTGNGTIYLKYIKTSGTVYGLYGGSSSTFHPFLHIFGSE